MDKAANANADDDEVIADLTELQNVEDKIEETEKRREDKIRQVEKEFSKELRPLYDERIKACAKIKGFWVNTMLNHPQLKDLVNQNDEECLMHLNEVDVQEIDDETFQGHKYVFRFAPNPFFEDTTLFKLFKYNKSSGDLTVDQTNISWKKGMNICNKEDVAKLLMGKQAGKKRPHDEDDGLSGFFSWFDKDNENEDFIGGPMKEIWEEPVKFFAGDVDEYDAFDDDDEIDEEGLDDEDEDDEEGDEDDDDDEEGDEDEEDEDQ
jgi:hypothetical protein